VLGAGCETPVGVKRVSPEQVQRVLTRSVLSSGELSQSTKNVLYRRDLVERFDDDPEAALADLHALVVAGRENRDDVFALAELSFYHAGDTGQRPYFLAASVYAYAFLFPGDGHTQPDPLDPRLRIAADLYNRGIAEGFAGPNHEVQIQEGSYQLPFGWLDVYLDPTGLVWGTRRLVHFTSVADLDVRGLETRYRWPGIGAPLGASTEPLDREKGYADFVEPWAKVAVTALLRIDHAREQLGHSRIDATLALVTPDRAETFDPGTGKTVPIEVESTANLAYTLAESPVWAQELKGFLQGAGLIDQKAQLAALAPYRPGRVPVVLVHGTASSAGRWAQMVNELSNDPRLRDRVQFWLFSYNTGNPILYSAMLLRDSLAGAVAQLDPEGKDPGLRRMVVIGHSQGGLLTKLTAVDSGSVFWDGVSKKAFDEVKLDPDARALLSRAMFVRPLPFVTRVVFIATPQRGSYFAGNWLSHYAARFITFPLDLTHTVSDVVRQNPDLAAARSFGRVATAVDNMTPGSRFAKAIGPLPVAPTVKAHSIIAVQGDGPVEEGDDGIVAYESAHIDGVESELVVKSSHSCQDNPHTIEEVRRILVEHLATP